MPRTQNATNGTTSAVKGKKRNADETNGTSSKKIKNEASEPKLKGEIPEAERFDIVDRKYYPPEMSNERCLQYSSGALARPIDLLDAALEETKMERSDIAVGDAVVHWYKCDLRIRDNDALHLASEKAEAKSVPLICIYVISPQDFEAHMTSPARVDFILRNLDVLKTELAELDIPLYVETVDKRKAIPSRIFDLCEKWGAKHLYANVEYEVDELRREASMVRVANNKGIDFTVVPDTCVVSPGELSSQQGNQYAVYSPWYRAWLAYLRQHPDQLHLFDSPAKNPLSVRTDYKDLFESSIPDAPESKRLTANEQKRFRSMWPAGEQEAHDRLHKFVKERITNYQEQRNFPANTGTSSLSMHFAAGTLSARTAVASARDANKNKKLDGGDFGVATWISEVAWRDFYKHVLVHWPYVW